MCELACAMEVRRENNPKKRLLRIEAHFPAPEQVRDHYCTQCGECAAVCPLRPLPRGRRVILDESKCISCMACVEASMRRHDGPSGSEIPSKCILCGACVRMCPKGAIYDADTSEGEGGNMPGGYMGQILRLMSRTRRTSGPLDPAMARDYIGGRGFVQKILFDEVPVGADPLGPENKVVVAPGPCQECSCRPAKVQFGALSPATGIMGGANMGGHFSSEVKYAGYNAIIIEGMSAEPAWW